jgi:uncharacterized protein YfaQ (DUF2300 family)
MIKAQYEKLPKETGGGYARWDDDTLSVFVDESLNREQKRLTVLHEVLEAHLKGRIAHKRIDKVCIDQIEALIQLGL